MPIVSVSDIGNFMIIDESMVDTGVAFGRRHVRVECHGTRRRNWDNSDICSECNDRMVE